MLLQRCRGHPSVYLLPNKPVLDETGGQLLHTIPAHSEAEAVRMIDLTENGKITATGK